MEGETEDVPSNWSVDVDSTVPPLFPPNKSESEVTAIEAALFTPEVDVANGDEPFTGLAVPVTVSGTPLRPLNGTPNGVATEAGRFFERVDDELGDAVSPTPSRREGSNIGPLPSEASTRPTGEDDSWTADSGFEWTILSCGGPLVISKLRFGSAEID